MTQDLTPLEKIKANILPQNCFKPNCPYCGHDFKKMPRGNSICSQCGKTIHRCLNPKFKKYQLVTEDVMAQMSDGVSKYYHQCVIQDRKDADRHWGELNRNVLKFSKEGDFQALKQTYFEMAYQMRQEGKDFFGLLVESKRFDLLHLQSIGFDSVKIAAIPGDDRSCSCSSCVKNHGKTYLIKEALKEMPLPCKECTHDFGEFGPKTGWCRCDYRCFFADSKKGN